MKKILYIGCVFLIILLSFLLINTVKATTENYETYLNIDYPSTSYVDTDKLEINGWVLSTCSDRTIQILLDGTLQNVEILTRERTDVLTAIPGYGGIETNKEPGFKATLDLKNVKDGSHTVTIRILTKNKDIVLAEETRNLNIQKYQTYLNLDYPATNYIDTNKLEINGWVLSTCSDRTIQILLDGTPQNIEIPTRERPDVLSAISGYGGAKTNAKPGFKATIDLTDIKDGQHTLTIKILSKNGETLSEQKRNLTIQKYQTYLNVDYPNTSNINGDKLEINGWVLSTCSNRTVQILLNGELQDIEIPTRERPDVLNAVPGYGGAETNAEPGFKADLNLRNIKDGEYVLTIRILADNGEIIAEENRNLNIQKYQTYLNVDYPSTGQIDTDILEINGWVLSTCGDRTIQILLDGTPQNTEIPTRKRPDVLSAISGYGGVETNAEPGFKANLDLTNVTDGQHELIIRILSYNGETLAEETRNLNIHKYPTYLNIDLPTNYVGSTELEINGWVMSNYKDKIIEIKVDGIEQEVVTRERPDVISAIKGYGGLERNPEPGFKVLMNVSNFDDGEHTASIRILTAEGTVLAQETRNFTLVKYPTMIYIDTPSQGHITGRDTMEISGWVMSKYENAVLKIYLNDVQLDEEITRRTRPDVINSVQGYGGIETNPMPGYSLELLLNNYTEGNYTIRVVAEKEDGTILSTSSVNFSINRTILRGIDISEHQGNIDWEKVKNEVDFVIIRCGYGVDDITQDDDKFMQNVLECKRLGIPYGIYLYSYAVDTNKAISEAQHVRRLLTQAGDYTTPEFGIWYDMEDADGYKIPYNVSDQTYRDIIHTFISEMKKYGYDNVGVYANLDWWNTKLNDASLDQYPKWVAQWNTQCDYEKDYIMWQYTSSGTVNGISGNVDMDYYYCYR